MSRFVIELLTNSSPECLDLFHGYFMLNYPHVKEFGSRISRGDVLLLHFVVCERIYRTSKRLLEEGSL